MSERRRAGAGTTGQGSDRTAHGTSGSRGGASLLEAILVVILGSLVLAAGLRILVSMTTGAQTVTLRADRLETVRMAGAVLGADGPGVTVVEPERDGAISIPVRAFRGTAWRCRPPVEQVVVRGLRRPDPEKDSVLLLDSSGRRSVHALLAASDTVGVEASCPDGDATQRWSLEPAAPSRWVVARYFERGSYHLVDGALRYRRGRSGRQPLTPEVLERESRFQATGGGLRAELVFRAGPAAGGARPPVRWTLGVPAR